jgi:N-acetylmuramoyl-L-alanine amidase
LTEKSAVSQETEASEDWENEADTGEIIVGEIEQETDEVASAESKEISEDESETTVNQIVSYDLYSATVDTVNLRSGPSTDSQVVQVLARNTALRVADINAEGWARVKTEVGDEGYVLEDYIMDPASEEEWATYQEQVANQKIICIDAGHQQHGNNDQEPVGPGSSQTKAKVSSGTKGVSTGKMEYELTLEVALKLQAELEQRGYMVIMCRTTNDVDISNVERATIANNADADAFLRIHADGAESSLTQGAHTICQTSGNPYNGNLYAQSLRLSQCVLSEFLNATGAKQLKSDDGVDERDDLSGINWCSVPVTLIELGFMTNPTEDTLMSSVDYQTKMATGIANGVDRYFN